MTKTMPSIVALFQMEVRKLNHVLQQIRDILENEKRTAKEQLLLNKICELKNKFIKDFSKEKLKEYFY